MIIQKTICNTLVLFFHVMVRHSYKRRHRRSSGKQSFPGAKEGVTEETSCFGQVVEDRSKGRALAKILVFLQEKQDSEG